MTRLLRVDCNSRKVVYTQKNRLCVGNKKDFGLRSPTTVYSSLHAKFCSSLHVMLNTSHIRIEAPSSRRQGVFRPFYEQANHKQSGISGIGSYLNTSPDTDCVNPPLVIYIFDTPHPINDAKTCPIQYLCDTVLLRAVIQPYNKA